MKACNSGTSLLKVCLEVLFSPLFFSKSEPATIATKPPQIVLGRDMHAQAPPTCCVAQYNAGSTCYVEEDDIDKGRPSIPWRLLSVFTWRWESLRIHCKTGELLLSNPELTSVPCLRAYATSPQLISSAKSLVLSCCYRNTKY